MGVLDEVQKMHPVIAVAVMAFKAVVSLELKRRDNDQRVAVLQVKMQDLMEVFVQLGAISPEQKSVKQKLTVRDRLESLCEKIAEDIKSCGNLCDAYLKKRVIVRMLKSPIYEARFEECAQNFEERHKELLLALLMFTTKGVHSANASLLETKETLRSAQENINLILLFQILQTPLEQKIIAFRKFREQERQLKNIEKTVVKQGDRVVAAIREGAHDRVHDPELRAIWKEMGWKLGVPAFEFVSTLHDYHAAEHNIAEKVEHFSRILTTESSQEHQTLALRRAFNEAKKRAADTWALKYINITNLQPLVEIFDGDMSGYVSVWEANEILSLRPEGWSLIQWIAYWAAGRHFAIWKYRQKIAAMLNKAHRMLEEVLPTNRSLVDNYLNQMFVLDQILMSTVPSAIKDLDARLVQKADAYMKTEEQRMERKLEALRYEIDAQDTLALVIGKYQIERNLYPLVYLLLRRHLSLIKSGCRVCRVPDIIFERHIHSKVKSPQLELGTFAYGMYLMSFTGGDPYAALIGEDYPSESEAGDISESSLHYSSPSLRFFQNGSTDPIEIQSCIGAGIEGYWSGHLFDDKGVAIYGMIQFKVETSTRSGLLKVKGVVDLDSKKIHMMIDSEPDYADDPKLRLEVRGQLNTLSAGKWGKLNHPKPLGTVSFSQTPAWIHAFRHSYGVIGPERTSKSLWGFAYN
ncbi:hypothetical protein K435DRAFT_963848, partial [Dendrothele bispora CBS 962.96]